MFNVLMFLLGVYLGIGGGLVMQNCRTVKRLHPEVSTFDLVLGSVLFALVWPLAFFIDPSKLTK